MPCVRCGCFVRCCQGQGDGSNPACALHPAAAQPCDQIQAAATAAPRSSCPFVLHAQQLSKKATQPFCEGLCTARCQQPPRPAPAASRFMRPPGNHAVCHTGLHGLARARAPWSSSELMGRKFATTVLPFPPFPPAPPAASPEPLRPPGNPGLSGHHKPC